MVVGRDGRQKPWRRRLEGLPGEIPADQFVTPTVTDPEGSAVVQIFREHRYADSRRAYNVWVGDQPVGRVQDSDAFEVALDPGQHRIRLTVGSNWSSQEQTLNLDLGTTSRFG